MLFAPFPQLPPVKYAVPLLQLKVPCGVFLSGHYDCIMKRAFRFRASGLESLLAICLSGVVLSAPALVADNPYSTIVERNAFALKPPTPPAVVTPPAPPASNVELRGITTLLGRPQVLLNFKMPGKPPEPPKDRSLVMDVGQREGEVEVLEINPATGSIRIRNQGNELAMNLKDNAVKPTTTVAPVPVPMPGGIKPANPNPGVIPSPAGAALPTRNLRSGVGSTDAAVPTAGISAGGAINQQPVAQPSMNKLTANVALYEANRLKNEELIKSGARIPRMPMHSLLRQEQLSQADSSP